mmetsp:Transcript_2990/g.5997  ORF Transcript_2990/g.5997 Transcript_2990/m.5997 type:complete len:237 (+) Transcript_2990:170-880(+)
MLSIEPRRNASMHTLLAMLESWSGFQFALFPSTLTICTASWLETTSQRPSEAMIRKSRAASGCSTTSGTWLRYCSIITSPSALDMASIPITRWHPIMLVTVPPAFCMRFRSAGKFGLWSTERGTTFPLTQPTALLSPALAMKARCPKIRHVRAVLPSSHTRDPSAIRCCSILFLTAAKELSSPWAGNDLCKGETPFPFDRLSSPLKERAFSSACWTRCRVFGRASPSPRAIRAKSS